MDAVALALFFHRGDRGVEVEVHLVLQLVIEVLEDDVVDVRPQVAHGSVQQGQTVLHAFLFELCAGRGVHFRARSAVCAVDVVDILHELEGRLPADVFIERAAKVVRDVVFAVRESARPAEAVHDGTGGTVDAALHFLAVDGTVALREFMAFLEDGDLETGRFAGQLIGGKDAAGARPDDDDIVFHVHPS